MEITIERLRFCSINGTSKADSPVLLLSYEHLFLIYLDMKARKMKCLECGKPLNESDFVMCNTCHHLRCNVTLQAVTIAILPKSKQNDILIIRPLYHDN